MSSGSRIAVAILVSLLAVAPAARAADREAIRNAIDRGVEYLKSQQKPTGVWEYKSGKDGYLQAQHIVGSTALAGLTLLECGVDPTDPIIQNAANAVRMGSLKQTATYSISLAILFLDRLEEEVDEQLIQSLVIRLLAGQNGSGGWTYMCPPVTEQEAIRLSNILRNKNLPEGKRRPEGKRGSENLSREIREQLAQIRAGGAKMPSFGTGDNSNTQFATIALWVGRRHGMPVDKAFKAIDARFRKSQNADGGWQYMYVNETTPLFSRPAMTCAGLLGLAVAAGASNEAVLRAGGKGDSRAAPAKDFSHDPAARAGLIALGNFLDGTKGEAQRPGMRGGRGQAPPLPLLPGGGDLAPLNGQPGNNFVLGTDFYFFWSLERVAVVYGLETIGNTNWYEYGTAKILASQQRDGSWYGAHGEGGVDTSFCLLFLRRSNVAHDLSASLKSGGVGGESLKERSANSLAGGSPRSKRDDPPEERRTPRIDLGGKEPTPKPAPREAISRPTAPAAAADSEGARLAEQLVNSSGDKQDALIEKLQDSKGIANTEALATAIPQLSSAAKRKARTALAKRMARMTVTTLKDRLQDDDLEIRRASALACAMKEEKSLIPDLIKLLEDPEAPVHLAAYAALKDLTGKDFGPNGDASRAERAEAARQWKSWWNKQGEP
jgi:hypothetical protein